MCEAFSDHLRRCTSPGVSLLAIAALEMRTRPGPVKERVAAFQSGFVALVRGFGASRPACLGVCCPIEASTAGIISVTACMALARTLAASAARSPGLFRAAESYPWL